MFTQIVTNYWMPTEQVPAGQVRVVVDGELPANRAVSILETADGRGFLTLTPAFADRLRVVDGSTTTVDEARSALDAAGVVLNDPDHVFHLPAVEQQAVRAEAARASTRPLTSADHEEFARFTAQAPADDLDEAFVELDHWLVVGTSVDGRLASVASAYPWSGTRLADVGVLTLPEHRGRGLGVRTVRALCAGVLARDHEPLYRCQLDNAPSVALARAADFTALGTWQVIDAG